VADPPNPYSLWPIQAVNQTLGRLRKRASAYEISGLEALKKANAKKFARPSIPPNGPYMGQVIWSYGPEHGLPPGHIYDYIEGQDSNLIRLPWIVVRIEELMSNIPNPAKYDPNGTPRQQFLYWKAIKAHFEVGICFPDFESAEYPQPNRTDRVSVMYTNAKTFSGGRYTALTGDNIFSPIGLFAGPDRSRLQLQTNENGELVPIPRSTAEEDWQIGEFSADTRATAASSEGEPVTAPEGA